MRNGHQKGQNGLDAVTGDVQLPLSLGSQQLIREAGLVLGIRILQNELIAGNPVSEWTWRVSWK
jgi:hypothetical protein